MGRKLNDIINSLPAERKAAVEALAQKKTDEMLAYAKTLADFRKAVGKTQTEVAAGLGIKQHAVSQLEQRSDIYVSTLQRFIQSLGMRLEFSLMTQGGVRIDLQNFHPWQDAAGLGGISNTAVPAKRYNSRSSSPPVRSLTGMAPRAAVSGKRGTVASASRKVRSRLSTPVEPLRTK